MVWPTVVRKEISCNKTSSLDRYAENHTKRDIDIYVLCTRAIKPKIIRKYVVKHVDTSDIIFRFLPRVCVISPCVFTVHYFFL